jgi:hypothetical protein
LFFDCIDYLMCSQSAPHLLYEFHSNPLNHVCPLHELVPSARWDGNSGSSDEASENDTVQNIETTGEFHAHAPISDMLTYCK